MNRLSEIRKEKNLNQTEVGKIIGKSQTGYSQYETETNDIPTEILNKLADYYGTSIDYLLCRTDVKQPYPKSAVIENKEEQNV